MELLEVHDRKRKERTTTRHPNIQLPNGRGGVALQASARLWRLRLRESRAVGWLTQGGRAKLQDGTRPGEEKREGRLGETQGNNEVRDNLLCDGILRGDWNYSDWIWRCVTRSESCDGSSLVFGGIAVIYTPTTLVSPPAPA